MTINQIETILKGQFSDESDRKYWENKLAELKRKEDTAKQNEIYFRKMKRYSRL